MAPSAAGLSVLKAMAFNSIEQCHLLLLYQSVVLMQYHWLWTRPHNNGMKNLPKMDRMQNEAMRITVGTSKDTTTEARRFILDLLPMQTRRRVPTTHFFLVSSYHVLSHLDRACLMGISIASHSGKLFLIFMPSHLHRSCCQTRGCTQGHSRSGSFQVRWHSAAHTRLCPPHTRQCLKSTDMFLASCKHQSQMTFQLL